MDGALGGITASRAGSRTGARGGQALCPHTPPGLHLRVSDANLVLANPPPPPPPPQKKKKKKKKTALRESSLTSPHPPHPPGPCDAYSSPIQHGSSHIHPGPDGTHRHRWLSCQEALATQKNGPAEPASWKRETMSPRLPKCPPSEFLLSSGPTLTVSGPTLTVSGPALGPPRGSETPERTRSNRGKAFPSLESPPPTGSRGRHAPPSSIRKEQRHPGTKAPGPGGGPPPNPAFRFSRHNFENPASLDRLPETSGFREGGGPASGVRL